MSAICERVPQGRDWQYFISTEASFRTGTMQLDPFKLTYSNFNHPSVTPAIYGDIYVWHKIYRRWDPSSYCVTQTGWMMRFDRPITELDGNLKPAWTINLTKSILGDLIPTRGEASFSLCHDIFVPKYTSHGTKKIIKTPLNFAKKSMSRITMSKFSVSLEQAQQWYDVIAQFAEKEKEPATRTKKRRELRGTFSTNVNFDGQATSIAVSSNGNDDDKDDDDDDDDDATDDGQSSGSSIHQIGQTFGFNANDELHQSIGDRQPGHFITHNPW